MRPVPLFVMLLATTCSGLANGQACRVTPLVEQATFAVPYSGGCKNGEADGPGTYTISVARTGSSESTETKVSGFFEAGQLSGNGKTESSTGSVFEGTFKANKRNGQGRLKSTNGGWQEGIFADGRLSTGSAMFVDTKNVRIGMIFEAGKQLATCREDDKGNNCPTAIRSKLFANQAVSPDQLRLASTSETQKPAGSNQGSQSSQSQVGTNSNQATGSNKGSFRETLDAFKDPTNTVKPTNALTLTGSAPFTATEAVDACIRTMPEYPSITDMIIGIYEVEVLKAISPSDSGLPAMLIPNVKNLFPVKLHAVHKSGKKAYYPRFVFKDPFGSVKCLSS